jgi:hypothetical protein
MKTTQTDRFFTPLSSTEAETINGGNVIYDYISTFIIPSGNFPLLPFFNEVVAFDGLNAWETGGSLGIYNYLLSAADFLSF